MRTGLLVLGIVCTFLSAPAAAQITITASDFEDQITGELTATSFSATNPEVATAIVAATGGNQTYDFTVLSFDQGSMFESETFENSDDVPGSDNAVLGAAEFVLTTTIEGVPGYFFFSVEDEGYFQHGFFVLDDIDDDGIDDETVTTYEPVQLRYELPLSENTSWASSSTQTIASDLSSSGMFSISSEASEAGEVEGWGTLVTPAGSESALRVRREITTTIPGLPASTFTTLEFLTEGGVAASIGLDDQGNPTSASYAVIGEGGDPTAVEALGEVPDAFLLDQNYPNPFNPSTVVPFGLMESAHVFLAVYDPLGREVAVLVEGRLPAGRYQAAFNGAGLPSGVYLYRMRVDGLLVEGRAMLLQK